MCIIRLGSFNNTHHDKIVEKDKSPGEIEKSKIVSTVTQFCWPYCAILCLKKIVGRGPDFRIGVLLLAMI